MILDFVEGVHLSDIPKDHDDTMRLYLNPQIDNRMLDNVYSQIADFTFQLYQFNFDHIGPLVSHKETLDL
jgi:hypothetical protein